MNRTIENELDRYAFLYINAQSKEEKRDIDKEVIDYLNLIRLTFAEEVPYLKYYSRKRLNGKK